MEIVQSHLRDRVINENNKIVERSIEVHDKMLVLKVP